MGAMGLATLLLGMALLVFLHGQGEIGGLPPDQFASLLASGALALLVAGWVVQEFRGHWMRGVQSVVFWAALMVGAVGLYSYRGELHEVASRIVSDIGPAEPAVGSGGEVSVARRLDGTFGIAGHANDRDLRFIFDTGASMVVLTTESAQVIGIAPGALNYVVPVFTANGRTLAAPVTLDTLRVGSITERRVRALVARPGVLRENLLGMTFLERLASYEVRGNRLVLRGRTT
jgi:aspartyl protease family protein